MKDFRRFIAGSQAARPAGHHRARHQPHLRPARLVQARPAQRSASSSARNWYVWSDTDQKYHGHADHLHRHREIELDLGSGSRPAYYWHRFFSHQPDLNFDNPRVVSAVVQVMKRWLDTGVDGFRLDAIPYLCERDGTNNENLPETHAIIKQLRARARRLRQGQGAAGRGQSVAGGRAGIFRRAATNATWPITSR